MKIVSINVKNIRNLLIIQINIKNKYILTKKKNKILVKL